MTFRNFKILLLFLCLLPAATVPCIFAGDTEQFKAKLQQIAGTPFAGNAAEYKAFSQNLGDSLVATADAMLALPDLSQDDKRFALFMKYWGLVRKYGFDETAFDKKLAEFVDSLQNIPEIESLYKSQMIDLFNEENFYLMETDEAIKAFLPYREKFVPFIDKYYRGEDQSQLASRLIATADMIDQDGSAGLVASTVEMLMPTLKEQEKSKDFLTSALAKSRPNSVRRVQMPGKKMKLEGVGLDGNVVDVKDFAGKVVFIQFYTTDETDRLPILKNCTRFCMITVSFSLITMCGITIVTSHEPKHGNWNCRGRFFAVVPLTRKNWRITTSITTLIIRCFSSVVTAR